MGYEAMREQTLARQKEMGIVPADTELPPINPIGTPETRTGPDGKPFPPLDVTRPWDSLSADEQRLFARMAEVYAGFLAHADDQIGRLLDFLEFIGERENTLVILVSDNGASGEGGPDGSVNEMLFMNGIPDDINANLAMIDELGGTKTYNHYPNGWAMAFNTPFKMWKRYEFEGGTADPCIISWPAGMKARGEIRTQYHHAIDLVPTVLDVLGVEAPRTLKGHVQSHFDGVSMRYSFDDEAAPGRGDAVLFDARLASALARRLEGGHHPPDAQRLEPLQRRRVGAVPHRCRPIRAAQPRRGAPREGARAGRALVRRGRRQRRVPARRPQRRWRSSSPRPHADPAARPLRLLPRLRRGPRGPGRQHPNRSFAIGALVDIPRPRCGGCAARPGFALRRLLLYIKDNRLHYVNSFVGMFEQMVVAHRRRPDRQERDPLGVVREGRAKTRRAWRTARCRCGTATPRSAKGRSSSSPAAT